ncbi:hypothetical protein L1887_06481 [Cichorium endivia]|nr:hypothetical protein L1887_06481 [Cichorium endivia]
MSPHLWRVPPIVLTPHRLPASSSSLLTATESPPFTSQHPPPSRRPPTSFRPSPCSLFLALHSPSTSCFTGNHISNALNIPCILLFLLTPLSSTKPSPTQSCAQLNQMRRNICFSLLDIVKEKDGNELNLPPIAWRKKKWCCAIRIVMLSISVGSRSSRTSETIPTVAPLKPLPPSHQGDRRYPTACGGELLQVRSGAQIHEKRQERSKPGRGRYLFQDAQRRPTAECLSGSSDTRETAGIMVDVVFGRWDTKATHWRWRGQVVRPAACIKEWIIVGPTCRNPLLTISRLITSDFEVFTDIEVKKWG